MQNRVNEIREAVPISNWNHCPGILNPADIPSRGITVEELSRSTLWRTGPDLAQIPDSGGLMSTDDLPDECVAEMKAHTMVISPPHVGVVSSVIDIDRFETLNKLYRVTACVLKFIKLIQRVSISSELTVQELGVAERWIKDCQLQLMENKNFSNWRSQFGLFLDTNQIWRCGGRLQNANLPFSTVHPGDTVRSLSQILDCQGKEPGETSHLSMCGVPTT